MRPEIYEYLDMFKPIKSGLLMLDSPLTEDERIEIEILGWDIIPQNFLEEARFIYRIKYTKGDL